jgi:MerR family transcriptional regulator/heat shock protein HspR
VDIILRLKVNVDELETEMAELRHEVQKAKNSHSVSPDKALVTKRSLYEMIIFEE